ncbi:radical SAM protein [Alkalibaculum sp. M08DMB]|uniref:Radical SAM protein n=1 Tax=Alkalibaculum sporogenes TaxID=2655001 RepID=A0A6A7K7D7_9FIRM|nr:radical SAM protein [Alkalibaculum sporogenes]MPW25097.1 radical SAM protein [Alkalibaculum sporogenes]
MLVSWNTTKRCNLYCKHCFRDSSINENTDSELSTEEGKKLIIEIKKSGFRLLVLSGGEPLLRDDIFDFISKAKEEGIIPAMGTNGTLLSREIAVELKSTGLRGIAISLDSMDRNYHDDFRGCMGAFEKAQEGIENALGSGLRVQINLTLTEDNQDEFEKIINYYEKKGVHAVYPFFLVPTGRAISMEADGLKERAYFSMIRRILDLQSKTSMELKPTCAPQFMPISKEMGLEQRFTRGCLAGTGYCCILPDGKVHICPYLPVEVGDTRETLFSEIWSKSKIFNQLRNYKNYEGDCGKCEHISICGGCRARAYYYNGNYLAQEPWCYRREKNG